MRIFVLVLLISNCIASFSQDTPVLLKDRILAVENSLGPDVVFGDSIPRLSLVGQMEQYGIKGLSIAVIRDYKIDWAKGYGWANEEEKKPVTTDTRFQAASISKSLNSLALLKLVQENKLKLDTDINEYLVSWKFPYDSLSKNKKITIQHLLSHTAGLSVHGFRGYNNKDTIPSVVQVLNGKPPANSPPVRSLFEPGLKFQYSGGGTTLSQLILTDITRSKYEEYMQKEVLDPLNMKHSFFTQPPTLTKDLATAYTNRQAVEGRYHVYPEQAAAGLWTTPGDLAKYIIETQLALEGRSNKVLNQDMTKTRLKPVVDSSIAMGSFILKKGDQTYFTHNGGNEGFLCTSFGSMKNGNGVVIMINGDRFGIINEVMNSVGRVYNWKGFYNPTLKPVFKPSKDTLAMYTGNYLLETDTITIKLCGENLCVFQNNQPPAGFKTVFSSAVTFSLAEVGNLNITMQFTGNKVQSFLLVQNGERIEAKRIE